MALKDKPKKGITSAKDNFTAVTGFKQAKPPVKTATKTIVKATVKPIAKASPPKKTMGRVTSVIKKTESKFAKPINLKEVNVFGKKDAAKMKPNYNNQDSVGFGTAGNKRMYAVKDLKGASKAGTLSGIDTTSNKTISQSGGKYNRMSDELKLGIDLFKNKEAKKAKKK